MFQSLRAVAVVAVVLAASSGPAHAAPDGAEAFERARQLAHIAARTSDPAVRSAVAEGVEDALIEACRARHLPACRVRFDPTLRAPEDLCAHGAHLGRFEFCRPASPASGLDAPGPHLTLPGVPVPVAGGGWTSHVGQVFVSGATGHHALRDVRPTPDGYSVVLESRTHTSLHHLTEHETRSWEIARAPHDMLGLAREAVFLVDGDGGTRVRIVSRTTGAIQVVAVEGDVEWILAVDQTLRVKTDRGHFVVAADGSVSPVPDGSTHHHPLEGGASFEHEDGVIRVRAADGAVVATWVLGGMRAASWVAHPDGRSIALVTRSGAVVVPLAGSVPTVDDLPSWVRLEALPHGARRMDVEASEQAAERDVARADVGLEGSLVTPEVHRLVDERGAPVRDAILHGRATNDAGYVDGRFLEVDDAVQVWVQGTPRCAVRRAGWPVTYALEEWRDTTLPAGVPWTSLRGPVLPAPDGSWRVCGEAGALLPTAGGPHGQVVVQARNGEPLPRLSVEVNGAVPYRTTTDSEGRFALEAPRARARLVGTGGRTVETLREGTTWTVVDTPMDAAPSEAPPPPGDVWFAQLGGRDVHLAQLEGLTEVPDAPGFLHFQGRVAWWMDADSLWLTPQLRTGERWFVRGRVPEGRKTLTVPIWQGATGTATRGSTTTPVTWTGPVPVGDRAISGRANGPVSWGEALRLVQGIPLPRRSTVVVTLRDAKDMREGAPGEVFRRRFSVTRLGESPCGADRCTELAFKTFTAQVDTATGAPRSVTFDDGSTVTFEWDPAPPRP